MIEIIYSEKEFGTNRKKQNFKRKENGIIP